MMKQWVTAQDGLEKLRLVDVPEPDPAALKEGEVLVEIRCVSLNFRDTEVCMGLYGHHKSIYTDAENDLVPTSDACGVIIEVGPSPSSSSSSSSSSTPSQPLRKGDRVLSIFNQTHLTGQIAESNLASGLGKPLPGVLTKRRVFPASGLVRVPEYLSDEEAACLPIAAVTAWMSINSFRPLGDPMRGPDNVVLLLGTGGVSVMGLLIAKGLGLTTIITSSSDAKLERAKQLGADHTINYRTTPDWEQKVLSLTNGRGADVIFETAGAETLPKSFACVAFGGLISAIGYLSGKKHDERDGSDTGFNVNVMALKRNVTVKGILNGPRDRFEEMLRFFEEKEKEKEKGKGETGKIRPVVDRVFEFEEAREALMYLFRGEHFGKVVVKVS